MYVEIVEVLERSKQGITEPFVCRCNDGEIYFVKGRYAGRRSLLSEWIAGSLAKALDLPVAPFNLAYVPEELLTVMPEGQDLGKGWVFASRKQPVEELEFSNVAHIPAERQQSIFAFDWWVANADRTLTENGGNPNLLWEPVTQELVMIDHNQAFDPDFSKADFVATHVFSQQGKILLTDAELQLYYSKRFSLALYSWQTICEAIPEEWWFADDEMTVAADFDQGVAYTCLRNCDAQNFWTVL